MSFARNMGKIYVKLKAENTFRNVLIMLNNLLHMHLNCFKKSNSKKAEATRDLIGNRSADKIARVSKTSPQTKKKYLEKEI